MSIPPLIFLSRIAQADGYSICKELQETERAHHEALKELERMRNMMLTMEMERAQMIAEVEDQIRMITIQIDPNEFDDESRPHSRLSTMSAPSTLRRSGSHRPLRSLSTDSTLVESASMGNLKHREKEKEKEGEKVGRDELKASHRTSTVPEVEEPAEETVMRKKRFSASKGDLTLDGMAAVDDALSNATALVNQSISNIQRRVSV